MSYRWVDHTAEVELHIEAGSEAEVFADALAALRELIGDAPPHGPSTAFDVELSAPDRGALLAAFLDELVYRADADDLVPDAVEHLTLAGDRLRARIAAHRGAPRPVVKGATYHRLRFEPAATGYRAGVVLDV